MQTLNRSIARWVVPWLARLRATPNLVTLLGLVTGLIAAWEFRLGAIGWLSGALWLQLSFILDNCDGALARLQGCASGFGSWLDTVSDCVVNMAFFWSVAAGIADDTDQAPWLLLGATTAAGVLFSYAMSFAAEVHRRGSAAWRHPDSPVGQAPVPPLVALRKRAREDFSWVVLAAALSGSMGWLVWCGLASSFAIGLISLRAIPRTPAAPRGLFAEDEPEVSA